MNTYVLLINLTQQGIENIKEGSKRLEGAKKAFKSVGGELKEFFMVMGQYDMVVIAEAPDDQVAARLALMIGAQGNIRTQTMRALTEDEYQKVIASLP